MNSFYTICHFEWLQFKRQRIQVLSLLFFIAIGIYAICNGHSVMDHQRTVIDTLNTQYRKDYEAAVKKFSDTLTAETKAQAAYAGLPQMINFRIPPLAVNEPEALASLSVGQRDVNPYYQKVKTNVNFLDNENVELSNPWTLFTGNFDLSFIMIYLLPLLIISLCYNVYAEEKEQGTYALMSIQSVNTARIMNYKLIFRGVMILFVALALCLTGFFVAGREGPLKFSNALLWCYCTALYVAFWVSICYFILQYRNSSVITGLKLVGTWLFFLILFPSLANAIVSLSHPIPLRADLASFARHTSEEIWNTKPQVLADSFNRYNPQYNASINPAKDSTRNGPRFIVGYYDLLERKVGRYASTLDKEIDRKNQAAEWIAKLNPGITLQHLYNSLAQSGRSNYKNFGQQISVFQKKWRHHIYSKQLLEENFSVEALKHLPKFNMQSTDAARPVLWGSITLWLGVLIFFLAGILMQRKINIYNGN